MPIILAFMSKSSFSMAETFRVEFENQVNNLKNFTSHGPSLGRYIEILMLNLLRKYMPRKYDFSSGFYYAQNPDIKEKTSKQIDIICFDRINYPILFDDNETVVVTPKSVKALIEIKSVLNRNALNQVLFQSNADVSLELAGDVRFSLLAVRSDISPSTVCNHILELYGKDKPIVKGLGMIYSLDWSDIIVFDIRNAKYTMYWLNNFNYGITSFINNFICQIYGRETYLSTANSIGPSLFIPKQIFTIRDQSNSKTNLDNYIESGETDI